MINTDFEAIPEELRVLDKWVVFEIAQNGKIPKNPNTGENAKIGDVGTYGTFEEAKKAVESGLGQALGFAVHKEDGYIFMDIDCHTGSVSEEEKQKIIALYEKTKKDAEKLETYTELSQSGQGVHLFLKGELLDGYCSSAHTLPIELYNDRRFAIFTGNRLNDCCINSSEKSIGIIHNLQKLFFKKKEISENSNSTLVQSTETEVYTDSYVLERALRNEKFSLLWTNRWDEVVSEDGQALYSTQHYADFALIRYLTFYTKNCSVQVERLFRQSPVYKAYGKNGKWHKYEKDIKNDIKKASETCTAVFELRKYSVDSKGNEDTENKEISRIVNNSVNEAIEELLSDEELQDLEDFSEGLEKSATDEIWRPDFDSISKDLGLGYIINEGLKSAMKQYISKYRYTEGIHYIKGLHNNDLNVVGFTNMIKQILGDSFIYSNKLQSFCLWNGKNYEAMNEELLYHTITESLCLLEHSIFRHIVEDIMYAELEEAEEADKVDKSDKADKGKNAKTVSPQELAEIAVLEMFKKSKSVVTIKNAGDIMKKLKGMNLASDIKNYYDSLYINFQNGVLNLKTKELLPHSEGFRLHKIMGCDYDCSAECPTFDKMLEFMFPNADTRKEFIKSLGLVFAKKQLPAKKALFILQGVKDTGKTTLVNIINKVLGSYATSIDNGVLMRSYLSKSNVGPELLALRETLFISTSEIDQESRLDAAKVKAMTGSTELSTRNLYEKNMVLFKVIGLIFIDSNFKPSIQANDKAMWGRLRMFPFINVITEKDNSIEEKLEAEKSGIFNRMLEGLEMVLEENEIFETQEMLAAKEEYKEEMSITDQFLADCVLIDTNSNSIHRIKTLSMFNTYLNWCADNNFMPVKRNKFYSEISEHLERIKSNNEYFKGCSYSELGSLYEKMKDISTQAFSKTKRSLLEMQDSGLSYNILRKNYLEKSYGWFVKNVDSFTNTNVLSMEYFDYVEWCVKKGFIPLAKRDYELTMSYVKSFHEAETPANHIELIYSNYAAR